jgi:hypothetical protein
MKINIKFICRKHDSSSAAGNKNKKGCLKILLLGQLPLLSYPCRIKYRLLLSVMPTHIARLTNTNNGGKIVKPGMRQASFILLFCKSSNALASGPAITQCHRLRPAPVTEKPCPLLMRLKNC